MKFPQSQLLFKLNPIKLVYFLHSFKGSRKVNRYFPNLLHFSALLFVSWSNQSRFVMSVRATDFQQHQFNSKAMQTDFHHFF